MQHWRCQSCLWTRNSKSDFQMEGCSTRPKNVLTYEHRLYIATFLLMTWCIIFWFNLLTSFLLHRFTLCGAVSSLGGWYIGSACHVQQFWKEEGCRYDISYILGTERKDRERTFRVLNQAQENFNKALVLFGSVNPWKILDKTPFSKKRVGSY